MSSSRKLKFVRKDSDLDLFVYAEHPNYIPPRALSAELEAKFGTDKFQFSLQSNVYVIYVDRKAVVDYKDPKDGDGTASDEQHHGLGIESLKKQDYKQRSRDVRLAQKVLRAC